MQAPKILSQNAQQASVFYLCQSLQLLGIWNTGAAKPTFHGDYWHLYLAGAINAYADFSNDQEAKTLHRTLDRAWMSIPFPDQEPDIATSQAIADARTALMAHLDAKLQEFEQWS